MTRLPPSEGQWIDRETPVEFRFEGRGELLRASFFFTALVPFLSRD